MHLGLKLFLPNQEVCFLDMTYPIHILYQKIFTQTSGILFIGIKAIISFLHMLSSLFNVSSGISVIPLWFGAPGLLTITLIFSYLQRISFRFKSGPLKNT